MSTNFDDPDYKEYKILIVPDDKNNRTRSENKESREDDFFIQSDKDLFFLPKNKELFSYERTDVFLRKYIETTGKTPIYVCKEIGHKLGVSGDIVGQYTVGKEELEASNSCMSHHWLANSCESYRQKLEKEDPKHPGIQYFAQLEAASQAVIMPAEELAEKFQKSNDLITLAACWPKHGVGVSLVGDCLIYTNTGMGSTEKTSGTYIYRIKDKNLITAEFIKKMNSSSQEEFLKTLLEVTKPDVAPIYIHSKPQKIGSCSFSNPKKNIKGILACLYAQEFFGNLTSGSIQKSLMIVKKWYKDFTSSIRDEAIAKLVKLCDECEHNLDKYTTPLSDGLTVLIGNYIQKQLGIRRKGGKDTERAKYLYQNVHPRYTFDLIRKADLVPGIVEMLAYTPNASKSEETAVERKVIAEKDSTSEEGGKKARP